MNELNHELQEQGLEGRLLNTLIYLNIEWTKAEDGMKLREILENFGEIYDSPDGAICEEKYARYSKNYLEDSMKLEEWMKNLKQGLKKLLEKTMKIGNVNIEF